MLPSILSTRRCGLAIVLLTVLSGLVANGHGTPQGKKPRAHGRTIDQVSYQVSDGMVGHSVLSIDKDGQLCHRHWKEREGKVIVPEKVVECFGYSVNEIAGQQIIQLIPEGEVATLARTVTFGNQARAFIVLSWGFDKRIGHGVVAYNLYVFDGSVGEAKAKLLHKETTLDRELLDFRVVDLGSDGQRELLEVGRSGRTSVLRVRRLAPHGAVVPVQKLEADEVLILSPKADSSSALVLLRNRVTSNKCAQELACYSVAEYHWSSAKGKFIQAE